MEKILLEENLRDLSDRMAFELQSYEEKLGWKFNYDFKENPLVATPNLSYSAKTVVDLDHISKGLKGDAILFMPQDGTGDEESYKIDDVNIPTEYKFEEKTERVIPINKTSKEGVKNGLDFELMLGLGKMGYCGDFYTFCPNITALEELTLDKDNNLVKLCDLTNVAKCYRGFLGLEIGDAEPFITTTLYHNIVTGKYVGTPHAIFNSTEFPQLAMFIGFNEEQATELVEKQPDFGRLVSYRKTLI